VSVFPPVVVSASQRDTADWDGGRLAQVRVSFQYCDAVYRAGGLPLVAGNWTGRGPEFTEGRGFAQPGPRRTEVLAEKAGAVMALAGGLVLSGGGDVVMADEDGDDVIREMDRDRDFWEAALFLAALEQKKPVLAICRGLQLINVVLGGDLVDDIPRDVPGALRHQQRTGRSNTSHQVVLEPGCLLARICGKTEFPVNSGHHQAARNVAPSLVAVGRSPDGVVEALEHRAEPWIVGVQWHPEALADRDENAGLLFRAFVEACA
jgi:putative glutamine amidotransferase